MLIQFPPIYVPDELATAGGIEAYAMEHAGWYPRITITDEKGMYEEIDNPELPMDAIFRADKAEKNERIKNIMLAQGRLAGEKQALETFDALFSPKEPTE